MSPLGRDEQETPRWLLATPWVGRPETNIHHRRAARVGRYVEQGKLEQALGTAVEVDHEQLGEEERTRFLLFVAQAQYGLGWYRDALLTIGRAQDRGDALATVDVSVQLMLKGIDSQGVDPIDVNYLAQVARRAGMMAPPILI